MRGATVSDVEREISEMRDRVEYLSASLDLLEERVEKMEGARREAAPPTEATEAVSVAVTEAPQSPVIAPQVERIPAPVVQAKVPSEVTPVVEGASIARGLTKSRATFLGKLKSLFTGRTAVDLSMLDDLEEVLITSDVGVKVTESLISQVREQISASSELSESEVKNLLKRGIRSELLAIPAEHRMYRPVGAPMVVLVVGVNGVGKTTTVAKLATKYKAQGKRVLAIAADTFRAAAVQQLNEWGTRSGFEVYSGAENAKPAAVVFDGMVAAVERGVDVVLIDTAGRLHTKSNLMQELEGVRNSIKRHVADAPHETVITDCP